MAKTNISEFSTTAASNTDVASIDITGSTGLVSQADDAFRSTHAILAKFYADFGGVLTVGGTGDAVTLTTSATFVALATGMRFLFKAGSANTTAATLNLDAIGAKAIRKMAGGVDVALVAGDILAGKRFEVLYDSTANAAAGAWIIISGATSGANTDISSVYLNNTGLKIKDSNASHGITLAMGSNVTADRVFTIFTGDAAANINFEGGLLQLPNLGLRVLDTDASHTLSIVPGSNLAAARVFTLTTGDQDRTIDITNAPASLVFATGTYTPTLTNTTNIAASTAAVTQWYRIGNMVTVFGTVQIDPTTSGIATELRMELPVASTFGAATQLGGAGAASVFNEAWGINGASTLASFQTIVATDTNHTVGFQFSYLIV